MTFSEEFQEEIMTLKSPNLTPALLFLKIDYNAKGANHLQDLVHFFGK